MDNLFRASDKKEKQKGKVTVKKEQTLKSLGDVENFLNQAKKAINHITLYKILK